MIYSKISNISESSPDHVSSSIYVELNISRVLKKINFLLSLKGMTITDWVNSCDYQCIRKGEKNIIEISLDNLVDVLEFMRIRLEAP